jgi:DNA end-binding protein Ku
MSNQWEPSKYKDDYSAALLEVIQQKIEAGGKELPAPPLPRKAAKAIVDLVDVLQQSVQEVQEARKKPAK